VTEGAISRRELDGQETPVRPCAHAGAGYNLVPPHQPVVLPVPDSEAARIMATVAPASLKNRLIDFHWPGLQGE
jgi:hypothetical protein